MLPTRFFPIWLRASPSPEITLMIHIAPDLQSEGNPAENQSALTSIQKVIKKITYRRETPSRMVYFIEG